MENYIKIENLNQEHYSSSEAHKKVFDRGKITEREEQFDRMAEKVLETSIVQEKELEDRVVEELNQRHAVVHTDQFYILTEKPHYLFKGIDFTLESRQSFLNTYENQIPIGLTKSKAKIWLKHPNRRQFKGITFDPTTTEHKNCFYNIWKGFSVKSQEGNCRLFKSHIEKVICAGNSEYYHYVWKWMARLAQKPDEIATGLVIMGSQGTGKGVFIKSFGKLFGQHFLHLDNLDRLLGNFNFHLKNAVLVFADEAIWGGNKKEVGRLKAMVTEEYAMIEPKGKDPIPVKNFRHFILASNEEWPVHLDPDDRRFLVLKVSEIHKEDLPYFRAIDEELKNGGFEALLYDLLQEDISDFDPREIPQNNEAFDIKMKSATSSEEYVYEALREGCFDIGNETPTTQWREMILIDSIFADYSIWCAKKGHCPAKNTVFGSVLKKLIPSIQKRRPHVKPPEKRPEHYSLPILQKARLEFQKSFKAGSDIWV